MQRKSTLSRLRSAGIALLLGLPALCWSAEPAPKTPRKPMAVWFYADWCMNCKLIAPKIAQVQPDFEPAVEFVKLDVTNEQRKVATRELAQQLGIFPLYFANKDTGWLALIDAQGNKVGELRQTMTVDQMRSELTRLAPPTPSAAPTEPAADAAAASAATKNPTTGVGFSGSATCAVMSGAMYQCRVS